MSVNDASRIIIDDSRVMPIIVASLTDDSRGAIYDRKFTGINPKKLFWRNMATLVS
jgi:hypothetical protein